MQKMQKIERGETMKKYSVTIVFDTERELTEAEIEDLELAIYAQVQEPADQEGEDAGYWTAHQVINTYQID
jgi:DNA polymerase elongation subunit (family B)